MLKVAMLSQWHVHAKGYANEFNQSGRAKIVAVWDEEPERGKAFAESLDCPFYENLDELLASDIDAVCVTTPTTMHRDVIAKAVKAGKHIFTEKALEVTVEETEALAKEIANSDKTFGISYPHKTNPVYRYIKARIAEGDKWAALVYEQFAYQLAKYIGSYACVLEGKVDAVVLTGGVSNDVDFVENVMKYAGWIAPFIVFGGDFEMEALAAGAIRALTGEEETKEYTGVPVWEKFDFEPES